MLQPIEFEGQQGERCAQFVRDIGGEGFLALRRFVEARSRSLTALVKGSASVGICGIVDTEAALMALHRLDLRRYLFFERSECTGGSREAQAR